MPFFENSARTLRPPPKSAEDIDKRRTNTQAEKVLLCDGNQLSRPRHTTWKAGNCRVIEEDKPRIARPGNTDGRPIFLGHMERLSTLFDELHGNCGTARHETIKELAKLFLRMNNRRVTLHRRVKIIPENQPVLALL